MPLAFDYALILLKELPNVQILTLRHPLNLLRIALLRGLIAPVFGQHRGSDIDTSGIPE